MKSGAGLHTGSTFTNQGRLRQFIVLACIISTARVSSHLEAAQDCRLIPIAVPGASLTHAVPGVTGLDIFNGREPGQFGWLSWGGSPSEAALVNSLSLSGEGEAAYVNPDDPADRQVSVGDWVHSKPGVSNSKRVCDALDLLIGEPVTVPVWDETRGAGDKTAYRVAGFASVQVLDYHLPQRNQIQVRFLGLVTCGQRNLAPVVDAGADQTIELFSPATLAGTVTDDGLPTGAGTVLWWSQVSGTGSATFLNSNSPNTLVTFSAAGTYLLRLTATDSELTAHDEVVVTVNRDNRAPVAGAQSLETDEDDSVDITLQGSDPDGDALSYVIHAPPSFGSIQGTPPDVRYVPAPDYHGTDAFSFRVSDGLLDSAAGTVSITIRAVNDEPVADAQSVTTDEDVPVAIALSGSDIEGSALSFVVLAGPTNGTLRGVAPNVVYAPATNFHGEDGFTFSVNDGELDSAVAAVSIRIVSVNDEPAVDAGPKLIVTLPATAGLHGVVTDDGLPEGVAPRVQWSKVSGPGTVWFGDATASDTTAAFSDPGAYVLRLTASDSLLTAFAEISVLVRTEAMNQPPEVEAGDAMVVGLTSSAILAGTVTDDGLPQGSVVSLNWSLVSGPGTVVFQDASLANTAVTFSNPGSYRLRLTGSDSMLSATNEVAITVYPGNQPPVVEAGADQTITIPEPSVMGLGTGAPTNARTVLGTSLSGVDRWNNAIGQPGFGGVAHGRDDGPVVTRNSVAVQDGVVHVAGGYTNAGATHAKGLASWDGVAWRNYYDTNLIPSTVDEGGVSSGSTVDWLVYDCGDFPFCWEFFGCVDVRGPELFVGGSLFKDLGNLDGHKDMTARWDGQRWCSWVFKHAGNQVHVIKATPDTVYLGGYFAVQAANATSQTLTNLPWSYGVAAWDGTHWETFGSGIVDVRDVPRGAPYPDGLNQYHAVVYALAVATNGDVYAAGTFTMQTPTGIANNIARWNGVEWQPLGSGITGGAIYANYLGFPVTNAPVVNGLALDALGNLYVAGDFHEAGGQCVNRVACWDGSAWRPLGTGSAAATLGADARVEVVLTHGRDVYIGGAFTKVGGVPASRVAKWNGAFWLPLGGGTTNGVQGTVNSLALDETGVYVAGEFTRAGGMPASCIAKWEFAPQPLRAAYLAGTVTDDGLPAGAELEAVWSVVDGPGEVVFANSNSPVTTATFTQSGHYTLRLSASDQEFTTLDEVRIQVVGNLPPTVDAGPDQSLSLGEAATLAGVAGDDGLPQGAPVATAWSIVSGPGEVEIDQPGSATAIARFTKVGTYVLRLTANDTQFSTQDDVRIIVFPANRGPSVSAGLDQVVSWPAPAQLDGNVVDWDGRPTNGLVHLWSQIDGPAQVLFDNASSQDPTAVFPEPGVYTVRFAASDSELSAFDEAIITVVPQTNAAIAVYAGPDRRVVAPTNLMLDALMLGAEARTNLQVRWFVNGPDAVTFDTRESLTPTVAFAFPGSYEFRVEVSGPGVFTQDKTVVEVLPAPGVNQAPQVLSGPPRSVPLGTDIHLDGVVTDDGLPTGSSLVSQWRALAGPGAVSFANSSQPETTVRFDNAGSYRLELSATDSELTGSSQVDFTVYDATGNRPPLVNAGSARVVPYTEYFSLSGTVKDDGLPTAYTSSRWSQISGPSLAQIYYPMDLNPGVMVGGPGDYIFQLTANDGEYTNSARVLITATSDPSAPPQNLPPVVDAGPCLNLLLPTNSLVLQGHVSDDGFPALPGGVTVRWEVEAASGPVNFSDTTVLNPVVTFQDAGTRDYSQYSFILEASDGELGSRSRVELVVASPAQFASSPPPAVDAGPDMTIVLPAVPQLQGSADTFSEWTLVRGPAPVSFLDPWMPDTLVTFSQPGTYVLRHTAFDWFNSHDEVTITVNSDRPTGSGGNQAPLVDAGGQQTVLLSQPTLTLNGLVVDDGLPSNSVIASAWSVVSGSGTVLFEDAAQPVTTATFGSNGTYVLRLIGTDSELSSTNEAVITVVVPASPAQQPPVVNAGQDMTLILPAEITLNGSVTDDGLPVGAIQYSWRHLDGPVEPETSDLGATNLTVHFTVPGVYAFRLEASDYSLANADDVVISVLPPSNQAPFTFAAADRTVSLSEGAGLLGMVGDDAIPAGGSLTASWFKLGGPGTVVFTESVATPPFPSAQAAFSEPGEYVLGLVASDSALSSTSLVTVTVIDLGAHGNQPPAAFAGPDQTGTTMRSLALRGWVNDDGLPAGSPVSTLWSLVSGPDEVRFDEPTRTNAAASFHVAGSYVIALMATDGQFTALDTVAVTITDPTNEPPSVFAGGDITVTRPGGVDLQGMVFDDELPAGYPLTYQWSKVSGSGVVSFVSAGSTHLDATPWLHVDWFDALAFATFSTQGVYVLRLSASDGQSTNAEDAVVTVLPGVNSAPQVSAGPDFAVALPDAAVLHPVINDDGLPGGRLQTSWSKVSGPGEVVFTTLNGVYRASVASVGTYVLRVTASDGELAASDDVTVTAHAASAPVAELLSPGDAAIVTAPVNIVGTVNSPILQSYTVWYRLKPPEGDPSTSWAVLETGIVPVVSNEVATLDPTLMLNGIYELHLTATDTTGRTVSSAIQTIIVDRNLKLGHFTMTFNDLAIPVPGLPLQITRTYDSRAAAAGVQGDFGVGWTCDIRNVRLQKSRSLAADWDQFTTGDASDLSLAYHLNPGRARLVAITFPDGRVEKFRFDPAPLDQALVPIDYPRWQFTPLGNTRGTLVPAGYDDPDGRFLHFDGSIPGRGDLVDLNTFIDWLLGTDLDGDEDALRRQPTLFRYTSPDGYRYLIDEVAGLQSLTDPNGNMLLIGAEGLTWTNPVAGSASLSIAFQRDAFARITNIVDAAGHSLSYRYGANGNLLAFTDRVGATNGFTYDDPDFVHHLTGILDGRGIHVLQNRYDQAGRIVAAADAGGNTTWFDHDAATQRTAVTNRLGHVTLNEFDSFGRLIQKTDPVGLVTRYEYDGADNLITVSNGACGCATRYEYDAADNLVSAMDELGRTLRYTYDSLGKVLTHTDADGYSSTNRYDARGNLVSTRDPLGNVTSFAYNALGRVVSLTDPRGGTTRFEYDAHGWLVAETNALGHVVSHHLDASGNRTSTTRRRTLDFTPPHATLARVVAETLVHDSTSVVQYSSIIPTFSYDAAGRLIAVLLPDGVTVCSNIYNEIGLVELSTDQLGRETRTEYDALGKPSRIQYPDGTAETMNYDAEGQLVAHHDRGGRSTWFKYDPNGRVTKVTYPDGRTVDAVYNLRGWLVQESDSCHGTTTYQYDEVGNRVCEIDPLGQTNRYAYNARRACTSVTDALGRTTVMEYDALNRNTRVVHPDGTSRSAVYSGRLVTGLVDERGSLRRFGYDAVGQLVSVTNATGDVTRFQYDEIGNRVMETDAEGKTALYGYDDLGRRIRASLPDGSAQEFGYDPLGRLTAVTNAVGDVTTLGYDARDSLVAITNNLGEITRFTHNALGQRTSRQDPNGGLTRWLYDTAGRLAGTTHPDGSTETIEYDDCGRIAAIVDRTGGRTSYLYGQLDQVIAVADPLGQRTTFEYDAVGNLISQEDPAGQLTRFLYDDLNRQTGVVLPDNSRASRSYDPSGRLTSLTDPLGHVTHYAYDANGRLGGVTDAFGNTVAYAYDPRGNLSAVTDALGNSTAYIHDENSRLVQTVYADGSSVIISHDSRGLPVKRTDELGRETHYGYDSLGRLVTTINALGAGTTYGYDTAGRLTSQVDANGNRTSWQYDGLGNLTNTLFADGTSESATYDFGGRLVSTTDANGNTTLYGYDVNGQLTSLTNALNQVVSFQYDALGRHTEIVNALGQVTRFAYDAVGRLTNTTYPDGTFIELLYDAAGRRTAIVDEAGVTNAYGYDAVGRLTAVTNALGGVNTYEYDAAGRLVSQTDANNRTTTYEHDVLGRRTRRTLPGGEFETLLYDLAGNPSARVDFNGRQCVYDFDALNRPVRKTPDASFGEPPITWAYDAVGLRTNMTDAAGSTDYVHDRLYRLVEKTRTWSDSGARASLLYGYDAAGNVTNVSTAAHNGASTGYAYDGLNRLSAVTDSIRGSTVHAYDAAGNLATLARPNGLQSFYAYDARNRVTNITTLDASAAVLSQYQYRYGPAGHRVEAVESVVTGGQARTLSRTFDYDALHRLAGETVSGSALNGEARYSYDAVGNRLTRHTTLPGQSEQHFSYSVNDQLAGDSYDANGNTTAAMVVDPYTGVTVSALDTYDHADRLVQRLTTLDAQPATIACQYDGDGHRVGRRVGNWTTHFVVDELNPTGWPQVLEERTWNPSSPDHSTPAVTRVYTYGHGPLSQDQVVGDSWSAAHFGHDAHGSVRYLTDGSGQVTDTLDYDAFGNVMGWSGTTPVSRQFSGEESDADLGLEYLRARYHNPATGRFWTRDSFEGPPGNPAGRHAYTYAQNDPVNRVDPGGHYALAESLAVAHLSVPVRRIVDSLWNGLNRYSYGIAGGAAAGPDGSALLAVNATEGLFIQGLSQHAGINIGRDNFFAAMQGAPFLMAANPFVFTLQNDCFRSEVIGFDPGAPIYGCPNRHPVFTPSESPLLKELLDFGHGSLVGATLRQLSEDYAELGRQGSGDLGTLQNFAHNVTSQLLGMGAGLASPTSMREGVVHLQDRAADVMAREIVSGGNGLTAGVQGASTLVGDVVGYNGVLEGLYGVDRASLELLNGVDRIERSGWGLFNLGTVGQAAAPKSAGAAEIARVNRMAAKAAEARAAKVAISAKVADEVTASATGATALKPREACATVAKQDRYLVSLMGKNGFNYYNTASATLGAKGGTVWVAPAEDYATIATRADAVKATGHAPGVLQSYLKGDPIYGIAVPENAISLRLPAATDAGANRHWRPGGYTGVEHNGNWTSSGVREYIADGGSPVPEGSVFFELQADGTMRIIRRY